MNESENIPQHRGGLPRSAKIAIIATAAAVALLMIGYLVLCFVATSGDKIFPNVSILDVEVSGMTQDEAAKALDDAIAGKYGSQIVPFTCGGNSFTFTGDGISLTERDALVAAAYARGREGGFVTQGGAYLSALLSPLSLTGSVGFSADGEAQFTALSQALTQAVENPVTEASWDVSGDNLVLHKGVSGLAVELDGLKTQILDCFLTQNFTGFVVEPVVTTPQPLDYAAIAAAVFVAPKDATLDPKTYQIVPHVVGISVSEADLQSSFEATGDGMDTTLTLVREEPALTTAKLEASLFRDLLGEAVTNVGGSANRASNVKLSSSACNGRIMLPGDIFSYNTTTGSRTAAAGYLPAPAYVGGKSVDETGGGICQTSSTLYYATLRSNLKIVERHNHQFAVGYVPDGMDATVYFGSLDYQFENNTPYPIKIVMTMEGRNLTARIYGTKQDENHVVMESNRISSGSYEVVYKPNADIPIGTQRTAQTPYTGRKTEAYRCIYGPDDKLISRVLESVNVYQSRNKIVLFNPADGPTLGRDPVTGDVVAPPAVSPVVSPAVPPTVSPAVSPAVTPTVSPAVSPAVTPTPTATPAPTPTEVPGPSPTAVPTEAPAVTPSPEVTPEATPVPTEPVPPEESEPQGLPK